MLRSTNVGAIEVTPILPLQFPVTFYQLAYQRYEE